MIKSFKSIINIDIDANTLFCRDLAEKQQTEITVSHKFNDNLIFKFLYFKLAQQRFDQWWNGVSVSSSVTWKICGYKTELSSTLFRVLTQIILSYTKMHVPIILH